MGAPVPYSRLLLIETIPKLGECALAQKDKVVVTAIRDALARLNLPEASEADRAPAAAPPPKRASLAANPPLPKI